MNGQKNQNSTKHDILQEIIYLHLRLLLKRFRSFKKEQAKNLKLNEHYSSVHRYDIR